MKNFSKSDFTRDLDYKIQFIEDMKHLDKALLGRIRRALEKIRKTPELGKPLHAPRGGLFAERVGKIRIIYFYDEQTVHLVRCRERKEGY